MMDWSDFCGNKAPNGSDFHFTFVSGADLSLCFQTFLQDGVSLLLLLTSTIFITQYCKSNSHHSGSSTPLVWMRMSVGLLAIVGYILGSILLSKSYSGVNQLGHSLWIGNLILNSAAMLAWSILLATVYCVYPVVKRAPTIPIILYLLYAGLYGKQLHSIFTTLPIALAWMLPFALCTLCHIILIGILIPSGQVNIEEVGDDADLRQPLLINEYSGTGYQTFRRKDPTPPNMGNWLSRLFFLWVQPLMKKGKKGNVQTADDLNLLPTWMQTELVSNKFSQILNTVIEERKHKNILLISLHRCFGTEYYLTGLLKLVADLLGFCGPLLLNALISYMSDLSSPVWYGYLYAAGLFVSTLLASLCTTHFDYRVQSISIKFRASLITSVFGKLLTVNTARLSHFSSGQTTNFISTDVDRTVNFCPSFHQFWSLPFQVIVSLVLLYQQVEWSLLAGLGFALLLIPLNRQIAVKIGQLSTEMMEHKDNRVKTMNEVLYGMRVVKMLVLEPFFLNKVYQVRSKELSCLKGRKYLDALCVYFWATTPVIISILTFTTYSLTGHQLTPAKVFTSLALFNMLIGPLNAFPWVFNGLVEAWVSLKRVQTFLRLQTSSQTAYHSLEKYGEVAVTSDAGFTWADPDGDNERIRNQDLFVSLDGKSIHIKKGELVAVIGKVGCGKTSFLMALLGEMMPLTADPVQLGSDRGIGLVTQEPWIQQGTIKQNVLMGLPFDNRRYNRALYCTALQQDVDSLQSGDDTEVGENGVSLSGGQRARLTLARAVYQDLDIYMLDDPLAAVDSAVAHHIYNECIRGELKDKTVILCTHHINLINNADQVILIENGDISKIGDAEEVVPGYNRVLHQDEGTEQPEKDETEPGQTGVDNEEGDGAVIEEEKHTGSISLNVYKLYLKSIGGFLSTIIIISLILMQASRNVSDWWLSYWVSEEKSNNTNRTTNFYLEVYGGLAAGNTFLTLFRAFIFAYGGIQAARKVHDSLMSSLFKARQSFFDTTAAGRVMNRVSSDVYTVDDSLPFIANILLSQIFSIIGTVVITIYGLPWFAAVLAPLTLIYYYIQGYYRQTSRELKRICSVTLSELYSHLTESVEGRITIRAFQQSPRFHTTNLSILDRNLRAQYSTLIAMQWLNIRLQGLGVIMVAAIAFIAVLEHTNTIGGVDPGLVGLAISYALSITNLLSGVVSSFTETEKQMVSVERVEQYIEKISVGEQPDDCHHSPVLDSWPAQGSITFNNVQLRYSSDLPYVLNNITLNINLGEKIGIIGRTGSGKSSLLNLIFRLVDHYEGEITIDDININNIPLHLLRSRIAIIPQTPFLFSGSLRENLIADCEHNDSSLWSALDKCHLTSVVKELPGGLDYQLTERGKDFSMGQSQLLCLARALLRQTEVLCIDEATANVDLNTDELIQQTIRSEFKNRTVLTIAHRISTVLHSDRVLVMSRGHVIEFDSPDVLLSRDDSYLTQMMKSNS